MRQLFHQQASGRLLGGVTVAAALGFVALAAPATSGRPFPVDEHIKMLAEQAQHPLIGVGMQAITQLGNAVALVPLILLVSCAAWRLSHRYALLVPGIMVGAGLVQFLAKWAIDRPRPNLGAWGFPSGHVLSLVVLLGLTCHLIVVLARARRRWCYLGIATSAFTLLGVAVSRVYLDAHWFSDVIGGFAIGLAYLLVVIRALPVATGAPPAPSMPSLDAMPDGAIPMSQTS